MRIPAMSAAADQARRHLRTVALMALCYGATMGLVAWKPSILPAAASPLLEWVALRGGRLHLEATQDGGGAIQVRAESMRLARLELPAQRGLALAYDATLDGRIVNRYFVLTLTLLLGWPGPPWRSRLLALAPALLLVTACSAIDLLIQSYWQEIQMLNRTLASMTIPATPGNQQLADELASYARRLQATKQFLSGGGRPFLSVCAFLVSVGAARAAATWLDRRRAARA